jgi:hypothetical protein
MTLQKIVITTHDGTILSDNSILISGQRLFLTITLSGGINAFKNTDTMTIVPEGNWIEIIEGGTSAVVIDPVDNKIATIKGIVVKINENIVNTLQAFTVTTTNEGYSAQQFNYHITDLDVDSLVLTSDKFYIKTPSAENIPNLNNKNRARLSTIVKNKKGVGIPNLNITISSADKESLTKLIFMDRNGHILKTNTNNSVKYEQLTLTTSSDGSLVFYAFPQEKKSLVLNFYTEAEGLSDVHQSINPLFVFNQDVDDIGEHLYAPSILELEGGILTSQQDNDLFNVKIPSYHNAKITDFLLFFVNGKPTDNYYKISNLKNLDNYSYKLPYQIFPIENNNSFGYIIANSASIRYSNGLSVTYNGGSTNRPESNKKRPLSAPNIYSSYGIDSLSNLVQQYSYINCSIISDYIQNGGIALYVEIDADSNDPHKVSPGDIVTVVIYINSANKGSVKVFYTVTIPDAVGGNISKGILPIPVSLINNNESYQSGRAGNIYFEYYKGDVGNKQYSQYWGGFIDTVPPGGDGC